MHGRTLLPITLVLLVLGCSLAPPWRRAAPIDMSRPDSGFPANVTRMIPPGTSLSEADRILESSGFHRSGRDAFDPASGLRERQARFVRDDGLVQTSYVVLLQADAAGVQKVETSKSLGSALDFLAEETSDPVNLQSPLSLRSLQPSEP